MRVPYSINGGLGLIRRKAFLFHRLNKGREEEFLVRESRRAEQYLCGRLYIFVFSVFRLKKMMQS